MQFIPNGLDQLQAPIDSLISTFTRNSQDPNYQFQQMMRAHFVSNPDQLQKWIDMEKTNPGISQRLGLGALGDIIGSAQESPDSVVNRDERSNIIAGEKAKTEAGTTGAQVQADINTRALNAIKNKNYDEAYSILARETSDQAVVRKEQAREAPFVADAHIAGAKVQVNEDTMAEAVQQRAMIEIPKMGPVDFVDLVRKAAHGDVTAQQNFSLLSTQPQYRQAIEVAKSVVDNEQTIARQRDRITLENTMRAQGSIVREQFKLQQADITWRTLGGAGTPQAVESLMFDPNTQKSVEGWVKQDPRTLTGEQRDIVDVYKAQKQKTNVATFVQQMGYRTALDSQAARITKAALAKTNPLGPDDIAREIGELNGIILSHAQATGNIDKVPVAHWGDPIPGTKGIFGGGDQGLYYTDQAGNKLTSTQVANFGQKLTSTGITPEEMDAYHAVAGMKTPVGRTQALNALEKVNPKLAAKVRSMMEDNQ
jgi:hypothetical protein